MKNSKYTLSANIINQISSILIFLTIPNFLSPNDYAQTVYISVLMSFIVLSDFGMSFVYSRIMPSIYNQNDLNFIEEFNQTFFWFRTIMSIVGSIIIAIAYYYKYEVFLNALLLIFLNPLTIIITFFIQKSSVQEDFLVYRNINIKNAFIKMIIIPITYLFNVSGWLSAKALGSLIVILTIKERVLLPWNKFNIKLIISHLKEGVHLLIIFFLWNQLLNSGRLLATLNFSDNVIALYGVTNAGYYLLLTLMMSIYLPVTVASLKIMENDTKNAIDKLFKIIIKTSIFSFLIIILAIEFSPYLFKIFFPKYNIDVEILIYQLLSLITFPLIATLGNIFIGLKQPIRLISIYVVSFAISYLVFILVSNTIISAAIAQFIGMTFFGTTLFLFVIFCYGEYIDNKFKKSIIILGLIFVPYVVYGYLKGLI